MIFLTKPQNMITFVQTAFMSEVQHSYMLSYNTDNKQYKIYLIKTITFLFLQEDYSFKSQHNQVKFIEYTFM